MSELKIERVVDGVATPISLSYTVESKLGLDPQVIKHALMDLLHNRVFQSYASSTLYYMEQNIVTRLLGYSSPFFLGGVVLSNENISAPDDGYLGWNVALDKTNDPRFVAGADILNAYSGSDETRGTINKAESYYTETATKLQAHLVFDFPTHSANQEFNTVTFTPRAIYTKPSDSSLGVEYLGAQFSPYDSDPTHNLVPYEKYLTDSYDIISGSPDNYERIAFGGEGQFILIKKTKLYMYTPEYGLKELILDKDKYTVKLSEGTTYPTLTPVFFNNKFYIFYIGNGNYVSPESKLNFIEVLNVQLGGDRNLYAITGEEQSITIPSTFISNSSYKKNLHLHSVSLQGQNLCLIFVGRGDSGTTNTSYGGYILLDSSFSILSYSNKVCSDVCLSTYGAGYSCSIPSSHHDYGDNFVLYRNVGTSVGTSLRLYDITNNSVTTVNYNDNPKHALNSYVKCGNDITNNHFPACDPTSDTWECYSLLGGAVRGDSYHKKMYCKAKFTDWVLRFNLTNPMQKTPDEVLKLTFDITVEI